VGRRHLVLIGAGISFGLVAEWAAFDRAPSRWLAAADFAVGCILIVCGGIASDRRPESRVGGLMWLSGATWFLGTLFTPALYLHRGPLVHLHLSYPTGRAPGGLALAVVTAAYVVAAVEPLASNDVLTLVLSVAVAVTAIRVFRGTSGPARQAGGPALAAALAFAGVLALAAFDRLADWGAERAVLWAYDIVIASVAIVLLVDLLRSRWADAVVTGLVVDLGATDGQATLRGKLAWALGDPSLVVGYYLPETRGYVDDAGSAVALPTPGSGRAVTTIDEHGEPVAILVHDTGLLADRKLVDAVAAAARVAVVNARLQAETRTRAAELDASRRRILEEGDAQRGQLEAELRLGPERRLANVAALLADARRESGAGDDAIVALESDLDETRHELREFAHGVHPRVLTERGLTAALDVLAARSPIPVEITGRVERLEPPVEAAIFFVCSEALANAAKHSGASRVVVKLREQAGTLEVAVTDDGLGGADPPRGSGLRGLADRVEALGGRLSVASPPGGGTRIVAELPLDR
jgi:signal transduction histidine kinase